jgi:fumarate hydratase class II
MGTALVPDIGYKKAAALVKEAYATGRTIRKVAIEKSGLSAERIGELLDPEAQAGA